MTKTDHFDENEIRKIGLNASIAFLQAMSLHQIDCEGVVAVIADLIEPHMNIVIDTQATEANIDEKISAVLRFYERYQVTWYWIVGPLSTPNTLSEHLIKHGMASIEDFPSMYFDLQHDMQMISSPAFVIHEAQHDDDLHDWIKPLREAFPNTSDEAESYRKLNASLPHGPGNMFRHYIGYYHGEPVSAGTLFVSDEAVMIHNIGTKPAFRYRGFGTAITLRAMQDAKSLGKRHCFLDASESGISVYHRIGFQVYAHSQMYKKSLPTTEL